ncbi:MAG: hypothetical protein CL910_09195 [Deltaproteobacteria bacterium]|nr:hypothetical protein [Deltaproteobacteria bacterium]
MKLQGGLAAALVVALALAPAAAAIELWSSGDRSLEWSGSLRERLLTTNGTDAKAFSEAQREAGAVCLLAATFAECPAFRLMGDKDVVDSLSRLRQRFDLSWGPRWSATVVYDHELRLGNLDTFPGSLGGSADTFLGLEDEIHTFGLKDDANHRRWRHLLYRGFLHYEGESIHLTVGRQRIPWGVGRLWNPIDRFNAIPPLAVEGDQSPGIDALDLRWLLDGFDQIQLVYAPGTSHETARYAARYQGVIRDVDVGVMAGIFEQARTAGIDLAGNLGDAAWRLEAVFTDPEQRVWLLDDPEPRERDPFWQVLVSLDYNFDIGDGLYVLVEHLYDGNALGFGEGRAGSLLPLFGASDEGPEALAGAGPFVAPIPAARFAGSAVVSNARHQTGLQIGTDLSSALRGDLVVLYDWNGESVAFFPSVAFTGLNSAEITIGAQIFAGGRRSQFGEQEPMVYLLAEYFF